MYAYVQQGNVLVSPLNGSPPKQIHAGRRPRWSPDSRQLAFVARQDGIDQIFLYDVDSGTIRNLRIRRRRPALTRGPPTAERSHFWQPTRGPSGPSGFRTIYSHYSRLYWQALNSDGRTAITTGAAHVASFALSPSGDTAVYAAHPTPANEDSLQSDLYTINLKTLADKATGRSAWARWRPFVLSGRQMDRLSLSGWFQ